MGLTSGQLFGRRPPSQAAVEAWSPQDVGAWAKSQGLPKGVRNALKPVSGKVLIEMTLEDFAALFEKPPSSIYAKIFEDARQALQQRQQAAANAGPTIERPLRRKSSFTMLRERLTPTRRHASPALAAAGGLTAPMSGGGGGGRKAALVCSPIDSGSQAPFQVGELGLKANPCCSVPQGADSMDGASDEFAGADENVASNAMPQGAAASEHDGLRDTSAPLAFAPSSQVSSAQYEPVGMATVDVSVALNMEAEHAALDDDSGGPPFAPCGAEDAGGQSGQLVTLDAGVPSVEAPGEAVLECAPPEVEEVNVASDHAGGDAPRALPEELPAAHALTPSLSITSSRAEPSPLDVPDKHSSDGASHGSAFDEHAAYLRSFSDASLSDVKDFLTSDVGRSKDLVAACRRSPSVGPLFACIFRVYRASFDAHSVPANAAHFRDFCISILAALGLAGRRKQAVPNEACAQLLRAFEQAAALLRLFSQPGWFLHLAFMDDVKGRFDSVHDRVARALQAVHCSELPSGRSIQGGDYSDPSRALRRVLRQFGQGSVANGASAVAGDTALQAQVAGVLGVPLPALAAELASLPRAEKSGARIDLAKMYARLNKHSGGAGAVTPSKDAVSGAAEHAAIFQWYDDGGKGFLDRGDLRRVLADLGLLDDVQDKEQFVASQFALADRAQSAALSLPDFSTYYDSLVFAGERHQLRSTLGIELEEELRAQFLAFANFGVHSERVTEMTGEKFAKYCGDCALLGSSHCSITDVDLAFFKVKAKGARRITFDQFLRALNLVAEKRGTTLCELVAAAVKHVAPINHAAAHHTIRLHDDRSTYTGVYSRGGPVSYDGTKDLSQIVNRKAADARGVALPRRRSSGGGAGLKPTPRTPDSGSRSYRLPVSPAPSQGAKGPFSAVSDTASLTGSLTPPLGRRRRSAVPSPPVSGNLQGWDRMEPLQRVFVSFAVFGKGHLDPATRPGDIKMDSQGFHKLMKEAGVMDAHHLTTTRADLCFCKAADKVTKRLDYKRFHAALADCAAARGIDAGVLIDVVANCQPLVHATRAERVRLHDDRRLYTGVHAQGGPSTVDERVSLQGLVRSSPGAYRGT